MFVENWLNEWPERVLSEQRATHVVHRLNCLTIFFLVLEIPQVIESARSEASSSDINNSSEAVWRGDDLIGQEIRQEKVSDVIDTHHAIDAISSEVTVANDT